MAACARGHADTPSPQLRLCRAAEIAVGSALSDYRRGVVRWPSALFAAAQPVNSVAHERMVFAASGARKAHAVIVGMNESSVLTNGTAARARDRAEHLGPVFSCDLSSDLLEVHWS